MTMSADPRYDDLSALFFNCTLKPAPQLSHTQGLMDLSAAIKRKHGARRGPGTCCTWPGCSRTPAASRPTATNAPAGMQAAVTTSTIPNTADQIERLAIPGRRRYLLDAL